MEHFHPHWGNAERDSTYTKAMRDTNGDRKLYMERMGIRPRRMSRKVLERQERLKEARNGDILRPMLRDLRIMAAGGRPSRLFDMMIEALQGSSCTRSASTSWRSRCRRWSSLTSRNVRDLVQNFVAARWRPRTRSEFRDGLENGARRPQRPRGAAGGALIDVSVLIATYGSEEWQRTCWSRAYPSA